MNRRRRTLLIVFAALVLALIFSASAFAAAGGGSGGFGGGGGGGGGRGVGLYILIQILIRIAVLGHGIGALVLIGLALIYILFKRTMPGASRFWSARQDQGRAARKQSARRQRRVELAAAEAAEEDPEFAPDVVKTQAAALFKQIEHAWDAGDRNALNRLVGADLMKEWDRRLDDLERRGWRNRVSPLEEPAVEYVGLERRGNGAQDHVTVRIEARMKDYVEDRAGRHIKRAGQFSETVRLREFWTLGRRNGRWILISIEQGGEGAHALKDEIVATRYSDEQSLRDESLVEGAVAEAVPDGTKVSEVADLDFRGDARAAALDLSLADGRFAPDVLEVAARRAVAAWAEAVDGNDDPLYAIAHGDAVRELLHPGDPSGRTRLVVRGPKLKQLTITGLDAAAVPPTMSIEVQLEGRRYIEDRDTTTVIAGSKSRVTSFTEHWTLALDGDQAQPWRIASIGAPVARS